MLDAKRCHCRKGLLRVLFSFLVLLGITTTGGPVHAQDAGETPPFRLIGVIESSNFAGAVLDDSTGVQTFYRLREELPDGSRIVKVENDSVVVKRGDGTSYELFIIHDMAKSSAQPVHTPSVASAPAGAAASAALAARMERMQKLEKRAGPAGGEPHARTTRSRR
jgi:hypothetical protein